MPDEDEGTRVRPRVAVEPLTTAFEISVVDGPDAGKTWTLGEDGAHVLCGTSPSCAVRLTDPQISRRHAALELSAAGLSVRDLGSTNGTVAGGIVIQDAVLAGGEYLRLGATTLRVDRVSAAVTPADPDSDATAFGRVVGASPEMRRLYPLCEKLAASAIPVVIEGETGTGKELLAEALHELGPRAAAPFVVFDCTAVPASLMDSALFGHERGAFTGATNARAGVFELADGGTLLIDEIGDLELPLQSKLLRAVERSEVQRVGGSTWRKVNTRIIAATRRDLDRAVQDGEFREDLFFRLAVGRIELPPLRRRRGDVELLARHFWRQHDRPDAPFPERLLVRHEGYHWPGNVRELSNLIARHVALGDGEDFSAAAAGDGIADGRDPIAAVLGLPLPEARRRVVAELERRYVAHVLDKHDGHVGKAAAASGIARRYFEVIRARQKKA